ncbi:MAG: M28 family peptidase [Bacteroidales bacterium]|nr:M28 family peptidase [Bacteroidales bacterium]
MRKSIILSVVLILNIFNLQAQDSVQVRKYLQDLCAPAMHGRGYAYNGDGVAADYIREQFKRMQIAPFHYSDYFERYGFTVYAMEGKVSAELNGKPLELWSQFSFAPYSHSADAEYVMLPIDPQVLVSPNLLKEFCQKNKKQMDNNCLLYVDMSRCEDQNIKKKVDEMCRYLHVWNGTYPFKGLILGVEEIPQWSFAFAKSNCEYVLCYVKSALVKKKNNKIKLRCTNELSFHNTQNVCAYIPGTEVPDSIVVIGAHYDHLGQMGEDIMFPGCHDNASGTATMLDMAHYFKAHPLRYTTIFVAFSGEEAGLMGSSFFVRDSLFDFSKVKLMLNLDLLCGGDDGFMVVNSQADNTKDFYNALVELNKKKHSVKEIKSRPNAANSDHYPFAKKGMPAVFVYTLGGRTGGYHQPDDTPENASLTQYHSIVSLLIKGVEEMCK